MSDLPLPPAPVPVVSGIIVPAPGRTNGGWCVWRAGDGEHGGYWEFHLCGEDALYYATEERTPLPRQGRAAPGDSMKVWLYTFAWNEARLAPFFLRHYSDRSLWDKIVVYDNGSTDDTVDILSADPRVEVRPYDTGGRMSDYAMQALRSNHWKEARGKCDWVYTPDFDEFLWHPGDLAVALQGLFFRSHSVVRPFGMEMVSHTYPVDDGRTPITDLVRRGRPHPWYCKPTLFDPDVVEEINFTGGAHDARPCYGRTALYVCPVVLPMILHYKRLGWDWWRQRNGTLKERFRHEESVLRPSHYLDPEQQQMAEFQGMLRDSMEVVT
jgi:hypothetical protein